MSRHSRQSSRDERKEPAREALEAAVIKGLDSGEPTPLTDEDWEAIRREVRKRHAGRRS